MNIQDFSPLIARIWDPAHGGFDRKYYTDARIKAVFEIFRHDSPILFADVVDTIIRKFRTMPTVEQFREVGGELRGRAREKQAAFDKVQYSATAKAALVRMQSSDVKLITGGIIKALKDGGASRPGITPRAEAELAAIESMLAGAEDGGR